MKEFSFDGLTIEVEDGVFYPTDTSTLIADYLKDQSSEDFSSALDLGCGSGIVALLMKHYDFADNVFASDIMYDAVLNTKKNSDRLGLDIEVRKSSMFHNWKSNTFDVVVNDVSGISELIAPLSPWFSNNVSCATGVDGIDLTMEIVQMVPKHLNLGGRFITPLLSLSRYEKVIESMKEVFSSVKLISQKQFYLPKDIMQHKAIIEELTESGVITVEKKFGLYMWSLYLYEAKL